MQKCRFITTGAGQVRSGLQTKGAVSDQHISRQRSAKLVRLLLPPAVLLPSAINTFTHPHAFHPLTFCCVCMQLLMTEFLDMSTLGLLFGMMILVSTRAHICKRGRSSSCC
jgi:hypothetical protein